MLNAASIGPLNDLSVLKYIPDILSHSIIFPILALFRIAVINA